MTSSRRDLLLTIMLGAFSGLGLGALRNFCFEEEVVVIAPDSQKHISEIHKQVDQWLDSQSYVATLESLVAAGQIKSYLISNRTNPITVTIKYNGLAGREHLVSALRSGIHNESLMSEMGYRLSTHLRLVS